MRFAISAVIVAALISTTALAATVTTIDTGEGKVVVPANSPVTHPKADTAGIVHFDGKFVLTGTLTVDYQDGPTDPSITFTPDADIAARLPRASTEHKVDSVEFGENEYDKAVAAIVPAAVLADIKAHRTKQATVHVALDVDNYTAAIEGCTGDGAYEVRFLGVHTPGTAVVGKAPHREEGEDC